MTWSWSSNDPSAPDNWPARDRGDELGEDLAAARWHEGEDDIRQDYVTADDLF